MRHEAGHIQARDERTERDSDSGTPGLVRALRAQLTGRRAPLEVSFDVSFDHEDYTGRNVLSITVRDDDDVDEAPVYYEQRVFTRFRRTQPSGDEVDQA